MNTADDTHKAEKRALRERMLAVRGTLAPGEVARRSEQVAARLLALPEVQRATTIFCYLSFGNEVATHALVRYWLADGRGVLVPVFNVAQRCYRPSLVRDVDHDLVPGRFGILEPRAFVPVDSHADIAVVPGLAFDAVCQRLGFGKGYYDTMLREFAGVKIGLAFDCQLLPALPVAAHDVAMDFIVTETQVIRRN
ncbi:MAG: 5-formyltetrahydrofolate cyclo-ligase [Verrucomicrobia bacterium]|nr:5-formyltetrahydrofolate cyclo-ligase [Verrucomicrobiota bacterium]